MRIREVVDGWGDWCLALVFAGAAEIQVWSAADASVAMPGGRAALSALVLLATIPLAWRRRAPAVVLSLVVGATAVAWLLMDRPSDGPVVTFLAQIVAYYSVGAHCEDRRAMLAGLGAALVFASAMIAQDASNAHGDVRPGAWLVYAVAWLVGRDLRGRRRELAMLRDRADQLERERETRARAAVAEERGRIARELHDVVAHSVSVMVVQAQAGPRLLDAPGQALAAFHAIETSGREALVELRRLLGILRTAEKQLAIGPQPGLASLPSLVAQMGKAGLPVQVRIEGEPAPLPPGIDLCAYRILQEALTNTLRHAGKAQSEIVVRYATAALELEVSDNGTGTPASASDSSHGIVGMRERAALCGGVLETIAGSDGGYFVRARLPLERGTAQ